MMKKSVIDASTLISLAKIELLDLLVALKIDCVLPGAVFAETVVKGEEKGFTDAVIIKKFIKEHSFHVVDIKRSHIAIIRNKLNKSLAKGDEAVLAAAFREQLNTILTDDDGLGRMADALGFEVKASPDLLMEGLKRGIVDMAGFEFFLGELVLRNRLSAVVAELYRKEAKRAESQGIDKDERTS